MSQGPGRPQLAAAGLMLGSALLFAIMAAFVKAASVRYTTAEIVFYRSAVGAVMIAALTRWRGGSLKTAVPAMHFWRCLSGLSALLLWFISIAGLPLGTAMTLNSMSSVWMALFLIGGSVMFGAARVEGGLVAAVLVGFVGVALVLQPSFEQQQLGYGLAGLLSGVLAATAYLQVTALGRAGEPEYRVVFYFSLGGVVLGALGMFFTGVSTHAGWGPVQLLAIGLLAASAQMMMTRAYALGHLLVNGALAYMSLVFGFVFGVLFFDDPISPVALSGVVLIVAAGMAATAMRARRAPELDHNAGNSEL